MMNSRNTKGIKRRLTRRTVLWATVREEEIAKAMNDAV
jgi:hypothetical protein